MTTATPCHTRHKGEVLEGDALPQMSRAHPAATAELDGDAYMRRVNSVIFNHAQRAGCTFDVARLKLANGVLP